MAHCGTDLTKSYEAPDASKIIEKDIAIVGKPQEFTLPKTCNLDDPLSIERGKYLYMNLNGKSKENAPKGVSRTVKKDGKEVTKQYGNCVACHNIEGAMGGGTVGPDLTAYKTNFVETGARDAQFVYQKIADPRIDNPQSFMTINLTTDLFNESEICDITAFVLVKKDTNKTDKK
jgi:sulfur-oxidizing protein SoxX